VTSTTVYVPYTTQAFGLLLGAFDANTGAMRWSIPWSTVDPSEGSPQPSAPVVANGVLFGVAPNGQGSPDNHIIADDARTGSRLWDSPRNLMNKYGDPIVANGLIYAASTNGHLDAFGPGGN
jgi:outer membrane protein assembly factor BamB